jgi:phage terminase small subunit
MTRLPIKHKKFADDYFLTGNATLSYRNVYKCSEKTANSRGSKLLRDVKVKAYLEELNDKATDKVVEKWTATANDILHEDSLLATHRVPGILDENGALRPIEDWPEDMQAAIKTIEYEDVVVTDWDNLDNDGKPRSRLERRIKKISFNDKGQALGRMEKALGIVSDEGGKGDQYFDIRVILAKIDGQNKGKLPQDCD